MTKILAIISSVLSFLLYRLNKRYDKLKDQKSKAESKVEELHFIKEKEKESKDAHIKTTSDEHTIDGLLDKQDSFRD